MVDRVIIGAFAVAMVCFLAVGSINGVRMSELNSKVLILEAAVERLEEQVDAFHSRGSTGTLSPGGVGGAR